MTSSTTKKKRVDKPIPELPINPFAFEVLELASKQRSKAKKVEVLQKYEHDSLKAIFIWNFDDFQQSLCCPLETFPTAKQRINQSIVEVSPITLLKRHLEESATAQDMDGRRKSSLRKEWTILYNFIQGGNAGLNTIRREMMFINLLRGLHPKEAEIVILIKDGRLSEKYKITLDHVKQLIQTFNGEVVPDGKGL